MSYILSVYYFDRDPIQMKESQAYEQVSTSQGLPPTNVQPEGVYDTVDF